MEEVNAELNIKTKVFLTKEDKIDLIDRMDITKSDLIDRIDITKSDLIDRINKVKTELIVWIVGVSFLQYILLMVIRKFLKKSFYILHFHTPTLPHSHTFLKIFSCKLSFTFFNPAGTPSYTRFPPASPASGPRSITQSADLITSVLCSITSTECP